MMENGDDKKVKIERFIGDFSFLSNFYPSTIYVDGERYATVEHAYQAAKTHDQESKRLIREASTPGVAKRLGRAVEIRNDWDAVKYDLMLSLVRQKFKNPFLRPLLEATSDAELVEVNYWNDTTWGVCKGVGTNWLGKILMQVREENRVEDAQEL